MQLNQNKVVCLNDCMYIRWFNRMIICIYLKILI